MCYFKSVVFIIMLSISFNLAESVLVETTHGKIQGKSLETLIEKKTYYGFMGIPYAKAPLKQIRFLPPQPIEPWNNTLTATMEKPACVQNNIDIKKGQPYGRFGAEDCLYLDIYTPAVDHNKRPTMVFIHNINFKNSHNKTKDYRPDFFIEEDIIIVYISHRLSVFGFLSMEDDIIPGNAGLKDIVQGLEWYKSNAASFGGDPEKVTLLGSQGGAAAVDLLIHSKANNLFSSAILQGGTSWSPAYLQENVKERATKLSELLKVSSSNTRIILENFSGIAVDDFLSNVDNACPTDYFRDHQRNANTFGPIVENNKEGLITDYPEHYTGEINKPILIGYNSGDGLEKSLQYLEEPRFIGFLNKDFPLLMPRRVPFEFDPKYETYFQAAEEIKKHYFPDELVKISNVPEYVRYISDLLTSYAVDYTVQYYSNKTKSNLYYYYFDYNSELNENTNNILKLTKVVGDSWGAASGDELCYLFMCPSLKKEYINLHKNSSETTSLQQKLVKMWSNFAKYGNPTTDNTLLDGNIWPIYETKTKQYLHIQKEPTIKKYLNENDINFWNNWITKWENISKQQNPNKRDEL